MLKKEKEMITRLENFINKIEECSEFVAEPVSTSGNDCVWFAEDMVRIKNNKEPKSVENIKIFKALDENYNESTGKYTYSDGVTVSINPFQPYDENNYINQKWHILISLLAVLDIKGITVDKVKINDDTGHLTLFKSDKTQYYPSEMMAKQIRLAFDI